MAGDTLTQRTTANYALQDHLETWSEAFLIDRQAQARSSGTVKFYRDKLRCFADYCETRAITQISQITPNDLRSFILHLGASGHNTGGVHSYYRAVKAFLRWYEQEAEPVGWRNPISKVKAPKLAQEPIEPVSLETVQALLKTCGDDFMGFRDRALILALLDTGARAAELLALNWEDANLITGEVTIRQGKGGKSRTVFLGNTARKAVRRYLHARLDGCQSPWLWQAETGDRLTYGGLRAVLVRRAAQAKVSTPTPHDFRRAFALNSLRAGMDVYSLQRLMGHADLSILRRYLAQTTDDLHTAHNAYSPGDRLKG